MQEYLIVGPYSERRPCGLYEFMLKNIAPYGIKGIIQYQGESDSPHAEIYENIFSDLIDCWRELWKEELPFIYVQLAPFKEWLGEEGYNFPLIRKAQENLSNTKSKVYMISSSDVGMEYDIHPKQKRPIGERMAISALGNVYKNNILCEASRVEKAVIDDGKIKIYFKNSRDGLTIRGNEISSLQLFRIKNNKKEEIKFNNSSVRVEKNYINIDVGEENYSYRIEFANTPYYKVNLYNGVGMPAIPFEININNKFSY